MFDHGPNNSTKDNGQQNSKSHTQSLPQYQYSTRGRHSPHVVAWLVRSIFLLSLWAKNWGVRRGSAHALAGEYSPAMHVCAEHLRSFFPASSLAALPMGLGSCTGPQTAQHKTTADSRLLHGHIRQAEFVEVKKESNNICGC